MKRLVKQAFQRLGYDVHRLDRVVGSPARPVGNMRMLLEDLRARGLSPQSILDVGANKGRWSSVAKDVFLMANCFLIEPQIEMKPYLDAFCQEFPHSRWFLAGAGATPGELTLTIWDDLAGSSFLPPESEELKKAGKQRRIPIITIDSLIEDGAIVMPQLVKLDIQGFELEALRGGQCCSEARRYSSWRYHCSGLWRGNLFSTRSSPSWQTEAISCTISLASCDVLMMVRLVRLMFAL